MNEKLNKAFSLFSEHFNYYPAFPPDIDFDQNNYADELIKCIEDDCDYTIEKYGTKVPDFSKFGTTKIFID